MIYKFTNSEIAIDTANTVYDSQLVRCVNPTTGNVVVTIQNLTASPAITICSFTILGNSEIVVEKTGAYHLEGTGILAAPVAYRY